MSVELVRPSTKYESSYRAYIEELGDEERYPFPLDFDHKDFPALLRRLNDFEAGRNLPEGYVPSSTYWLVEHGELVGVSNLRHFLNEKIFNAGGHIGIGIRPQARGRGLGNLLLSLTIAEARKRGIGELHIHCHKHNEASARMIMANGGVLDSEISDGKSADFIQRYIVSERTNAG
ncbi:GNAT family N-acetyltransferase [Arenimonas sp. GDDSR-1]|uniref:GNAT family N-acetyltransferase n=1 Tax=Arenimonas sp. GDDSR-1 TaxID=2950125 RepID=UPI0026312754|nr:GNAT family N-acetyltransferase [Arenimonas sp. GDDSR-1]